MWFCLAFPHDSWCWVSLHISVGQFYIFFGKMSVQFLCPLFNQLICRFSVATELRKLLVYLGINLLRYFVLFLSLPFYFVDRFLRYAEAFWFDIVSYYFCFYYFWFWCHIQEIFFNFLYKCIYFNWKLITLQYCIGFAILRHESAMGVHCVPHPEPPPASLPIPSL